MPNASLPFANSNSGDGMLPNLQERAPGYRAVTPLLQSDDGETTKPQLSTDGQSIGFYSSRGSLAEDGNGRFFDVFVASGHADGIFCRRLAERMPHLANALKQFRMDAVARPGSMRKRSIARATSRNDVSGVKGVETI